MDIRKVIAGLCAVALVAQTFLFGAGYAVGQTVLNDPEFDDALAWAYENQMTKYNTVETFMPFNNITREQSAKFVDVFAMTNLCLQPDTDLACDFSDVPADPTLDQYVRLSCQLGIFKGSQGQFYPTANLTKAQLISVLVRAIRAADGLDPLMDETGTPRWGEYFAEARSMGLTQEVDVNALDRPVTRYESLLLIYRSANAIDLECSTSSDDILDLLDDLFGDDDDDDTDDDDMDDEDDVDAPTESDGTLEVSLSPTTPAGDTVPGKASVPVAEFELSATGEPVTLNSLILKRLGLGDDDVVERVTLFLNDGDHLTRLSNDKSFNSEDEAILTLNPRLEVPVGDSVFVTVVAEIGDSATYSNEQFRMSIPTDDHVLTNGDVDGDFPVTANTFEVAGIDAPEVVIKNDGSVSDVELGEMGAEIAEFEIDSDNDDVTITNITLTDDEGTIDDAAENFVLTCEGEDVAMTEFSNNDLLQFNLTSPLDINEGQSANCSVHADIIAEAGESIELLVEESLDVWGESDIGFGIAVDVTNFDDAGEGHNIAILAGELTLVEEDLPRDQVRDNTDDVILGQFSVVVNAGQDLFVEDISFDFETDANSANNNIGDLLEDFEIYDVTNNVRYDLEDDCATATGSCDLSEDGIDIFLPDGGEVLLQVRADTVTNFANASPAFDPSTDTFTFHLELNANPTGNDLVILEASDDERVDSIVPSFLSFDQIDLVEGEVVVNELPLSDIDVVRGATDVVALRFQIETDEVSPAFLQDITFDATDDFDSDNVSAVRLYRGLPNGTNTLVEAQGGFDIVGNSITFDSFSEIEIPQNSTQPMFVTVDIIDNPQNTGNTVTLKVDGTTNPPEFDDDDNDDIDNVTVNSNGTRTITIEDFGSLTCEFDNDVNRPSVVVGGTTSDHLASFEFNANNEPIWIRDLEITATGTTANGVTGNVNDFVDAFDEVTILADDGVTELYSEFITSNVMYLNEVNGPGGGDLVIDEGSENIYVQMTASLIGNNQNGVEAGPFELTMNVAEAEGDNSGQDLNTVTCSNGPSEHFVTRAVRVADLDFLGVNESSNGYSYDTLTNGNGKNIGIFTVTADSWSNTDTDGSSLDLLLSGMTLTISNNSLVTGDVSLTRIDTSTETTLTGNNVSGGDYEFDLAGLTQNEKTMDSGQTATFLVEADLAGVDDNDSISVNFNNLDNGHFVWTHDGSGAAVNSFLYLDNTTESGPSVSN